MSTSVSEPILFLHSTHELGNNLPKLGPVLGCCRLGIGLTNDTFSGRVFGVCMLERRAPGAGL